MCFINNIENRTKVFFIQQIGKKENETESLWCIADGDNFILDNIPFVAERVSLGDIIKAKLDDDGQFYFEDFVANSGNTTVRIYFYNDFLSKIDETRKWLKDNRCQTELFLDRNIVAVNIPKTISYIPIKKYLDDGEEKFWSYEESCLEHEY